MAIVRKSDNVIELTINGSDGNPITITGMADLEVVAYQLPKTIIQRWLLSDAEITIEDDAGGVVSVNFDRANTKLLNFKIDDCKLEVIASFTDSNFADNIRREVDTDIELTIVEDSPTAYET
jgi:methyl coenzyme M reductase subunit C-like uncharacterized protein (methanogenesis marker protein 7)